MSTTLNSDPGKRVLPKREVLRQNVIEKLDRLTDESLVVLHDLTLELEMRAAWDEFSAGMTEDWAAGNYANLDQAIAEARRARHDSSNS